MYAPRALAAPNSRAFLVDKPTVDVLVASLLKRVPWVPPEAATSLVDILTAGEISGVLRIAAEYTAGKYGVAVHWYISERIEVSPGLVVVFVCGILSFDSV